MVAVVWKWWWGGAAGMHRTWEMRDTSSRAAGDSLQAVTSCATLVRAAASTPPSSSRTCVSGTAKGSLMTGIGAA